jgi:predicted DNA-binding protein
MKKDTSVNLRLTAELKSKLQRLADLDGRKLSNYIERVLVAHVENQGGSLGRGESEKKKR